MLFHESFFFVFVYNTFGHKSAQKSHIQQNSHDAMISFDSWTFL